MYAIVDIETTGGSASSSGITEIAIILYNGQHVEHRFATLVNPMQPVPRYITALTGIQDSMLQDAPTFAAIAKQVFDLLQGRVFVAHNVNFDYSFVYHQLQQEGFEWQAKKLCTVRYARKVLPGLPSYSLGNLCQHVAISNTNRHRAHGDATATLQLLEHLMQQDTDHKHLSHFLKGKTPETYLPMHVPVEQIIQLPYCAGVYYFKDKTGKVVYVGKAKNLNSRVKSHFSNNSISARKQALIRSVFAIHYEVCVTELHALVLEEMEIKRLWPLFNRSQKRYNQLYALYAYQDQLGLWRMMVEKRRKHLPPLLSIEHPEEGYRIGRQLLQQFDIKENWMFGIGTSSQAVGENDIENHNQKMQQAFLYLQEQLPSIHLFQQGANEMGHPKKVHFFISKGVFSGMLVTDLETTKTSRDLLEMAAPVQDNDYIKSCIRRIADINPECVKTFI